MRPFALFSATGFCLLLTGCSHTAMQPTPEPSETICPEPRPQICTMDYRPVCGHSFSGETRTYSNGCAACGDDEIRAYVEEACPGSLNSAH